jgi:uncharacterized protein (DUF1015 family)
MLEETLFSEVDTIMLERLIEDNEWITQEGMRWNKKFISLQDVINGIANLIPEQTERYKENQPKSDEWHIGRIIYFVNNPDKIKPISIESFCFNDHLYNSAIIADGHHRLMAQLIMGRQYIEVCFGGLVHLLDYLTGKIDKKEEI